MNIYSKKQQFVIKIISIVAIIILTLCEINYIFFKYIFNTGFSYDTVSFLVNVFAISMISFLIIWPSKIEIIALIAFMFMAMTLIYEPDNPMGVCMFLLEIAILKVRNFFSEKALLKSISLVVIYVLLLLTELRFGFSVFFNAFIWKIGLFFVCLLTIYFVQFYVSERKSDNRILNLYDYPQLTKRDALWLQKVIQKIKYDAIAREEGMSLGSVKNRFRFIFNVLEVGDKIGFLNKYSEYKIEYFEQN